jgi:hypothetical protein
MGTTPIYGFRYPELGVSADGPDAVSKLALDVEGELSTSDVQSFTPTWGAFGLGGATINPSGAASRIMRYTVDRGVCTIACELTFGGSTNGGRGQLYLTLPVAPRADLIEQKLPCTTNIPSMGTFWGVASLFAGVAQAWPLFLLSSNGVMGGWKSSDGTGASGIGTPTVPSGSGNGYPIQIGGNFIMTGSYLV